MTAKEKFSPYRTLDYIKTEEDLEAYVQARLEEVMDEREWGALERENAALRWALEALVDEQNGPPLERRREQWQRAYDHARHSLREAAGAADETMVGQTVADMRTITFAVPHTEACGLRAGGWYCTCRPAANGTDAL